MELVLVLVALFALVLCPILLSYGFWGWAILAVIFFLASCWGIVCRSVLIQSALAVLLGFIFSSEKRAMITASYTGVRVSKQKKVSNKMPSGMLTPRARKLINAICWAPVALMIECWGLLLAIPNAIGRLWRSMLSWRPKFNRRKPVKCIITEVPVREESLTLDEIAKHLRSQGATVGDSTTEGVIAAIGQLVERAKLTQAPTGLEFKARTLVGKLLGQLGVVFDKAASIESLIELAVDSVENSLSVLKVTSVQRFKFLRKLYPINPCLKSSF